MMDEVMMLITERNSIETYPFIPVYESNASLQSLVDILQQRNEDLEREVAETVAVNMRKIEDGKANLASSKNELRLRDKVEKLQEQLNEKLRTEVESSTSQLRTTTEVVKLMDSISSNESTIDELKTLKIKAEEEITDLKSQLKNAETTASFATKQYESFKEELDMLREESMELRTTNEQLVNRIISEKDKTVMQFNQMNDMMMSQKKEIEMLRAYKEINDKVSLEAPTSIEKGNEEYDGQSKTRKWGGLGVVVPSEPKFIIKAHASEIISVRYDGTGSDLVATASCDSTIKVWDTTNGRARSTLRGNSGQPMLGVDINGGLVAGCSSDKMIRIWSLKTDRMIHQLVGHMNKVTCVRFSPDSRSVVSASADRSIKVWDIARHTYKVNTTMRHGSTSNCIDVGSDGLTIATGHMDGGIRLWDMRKGDRSTEIRSIHTGGVTSVQFDPKNSNVLLTNGRDSSISFSDIRMGSVVQTLQHKNFRTTFNWSSASFSANGMYVVAASGMNGDTFIWRTDDGYLEKHLVSHNQGVGGVAWGGGGTNGQQVATVDRSGVLVLWS